jgi:hypothetical protein
MSRKIGSFSTNISKINLLRWFGVPETRHMCSSLTYRIHPVECRLMRAANEIQAVYGGMVLLSAL